jgi:hypothetical protein
VSGLRRSHYSPNLLQDGKVHKASSLQAEVHVGRLTTDKAE